MKPFGQDRCITRTDADRRLPHRVAAVLSALALASVVAACGSSSNGSSATSASGSGSSSSGTPTVTIAYTAPVADQMLLPVTQAAGLFKKNGVNVKVKFLQASLATPALVGNQVQFVVVGAPSAEVASLSGTPLKFVGQWENVLDAAIVANKSVGSVKDMNGKSVAISSAGALSDFLVQIADRKYGVNMREVPLGQLPNETSAYRSGSVDAISGTNSWQLPSLQSDSPGTHAIVDFRTEQGYPGSGSIIADGNWLNSKGNGATTVKVLRALHQGISYFKTHPSTVIPIIAKETDEPTAEARQAYAVVKALYTPSIVPILADQQNVLKALAPTNPQAKTYDAAKLLDASYAQQAQK